MALKLLTLLALFAACGIVHVEKNDYCSTICGQYQDPTARNVVRGQKHRASRSKGHLTRGNQRAVSLADFCSAYCQDGAISTRQFDSFYPAFQYLVDYINGVSGSGSGSSDSGSGLSGGGLDFPENPDPQNLPGFGSSSQSSSTGESGTSASGSDGSSTTSGSSSGSSGGSTGGSSSGKQSSSGRSGGSTNGFNPFI